MHQGGLEIIHVPISNAVRLCEVHLCSREFGGVCLTRFPTYYIHITYYYIRCTILSKENYIILFKYYFHHFNNVEIQTGKQNFNLQNLLCS